MWYERLEARPGLYISWVTRKRRIHPRQRLDEASPASVGSYDAAPGKFLYQPRHGKKSGDRVAAYQAIPSDTVQGLAEVFSGGMREFRFEDELRNRLGCKPCQPLQESSTIIAQTRDRQLPGRGDRTRVFQYRGIVPLHDVVPILPHLLAIFGHTR